MANFLKFKVTEKIGDGYFGVGGLGAPAANGVLRVGAETPPPREIAPALPRRPTPAASCLSRRAAQRS